MIPTDISLKDGNDKNCTGYAICNFFLILLGQHLLATLAQQLELYTYFCRRILSKGKTVNIYSDNRYSFGVVQKQHGFLAYSEITIKNGPSPQELLDAILLPAIFSYLDLGAF